MSLGQLKVMSASSAAARALGGHVGRCENLLLACAQCNGNKSDKFPVVLTKDADADKVIFLTKTNGLPLNPILIDPSEDGVDPEEFIGFNVDDNDQNMVGLPKAYGNNKRGAYTISVTGIDGEYYCKERRSWYWNVLFPAYLQMCQAKDLNHKPNLQLAVERFTLYLSEKQKFAAFARAFARLKRMKDVFGLEIPGRRRITGAA